MCKLEWQSLWDPSVLRVWTGKSNKLVDIPVVQPELMEAIASIPKEHYLYCFPLKRSQYLSIFTHMVQEEFATLCRRARVKDITFHCLRHTFASQQHEAGKPAEWIAKWIGHTSEELTRMVYIHPRQQPEMWNYEDVTIPPAPESARETVSL